MDAQKKERIMEKVKALLELGSSQNEYEANLAMQRAGEIMAKYEIEMVDIRQKDTTIDEVEDLSIKCIFSGQDQKWEKTLSHMIARHFGCKSINRADGVHITFCGFHQDVQITEYYFRYLRRQIGVEAWGMKKNTGWSYACGFIQTIDKRLNEMKRYKDQVIRESGSMDLVLARNLQVDRFYKNLFPNTTHGRASSMRIDNNAWQRGFEDGKSVSLGRPISGSSGGNGQRALK